MAFQISEADPTDHFLTDLNSADNDFTSSLFKEDIYGINA